EEDALAVGQQAPRYGVGAAGEVDAVAAAAVEHAAGAGRAVDDGSGGPLGVGGQQLGVEDLAAHALSGPALHRLQVVGAAHRADVVHVHLAGAAPAVDELDVIGPRQAAQLLLGERGLHAQPARLDQLHLPAHGVDLLGHGVLPLRPALAEHDGVP